MSSEYNKAGTYVAICNDTNFKGHYIKIFEYPQSFHDEWNAQQGLCVKPREQGGLGFPKIPVPDAAWYFLNKVDFEACIERVYPIAIFHPVVDHHATKMIKLDKILDGHRNTR